MPEPKKLEQVRALLAQAEHPTTSQAEAEVFTARATELMAKYGIDAALLAAAGKASDEVVRKKFAIEQPYTREKCQLLISVAVPLRCKVIRHYKGRVTHAATMFGFASDVERVELLYTSLLLQATRDVLRQTVPQQEDTAAYRRSWLLGFAAAVYRRLDDAERRAAQEAEPAAAASSSSSVELVLADRTAIVQRSADEAFPNLQQGRELRGKGSGGSAGYRSGQRADLGGAKVTGDDQGQIGGGRNAC